MGNAHKMCRETDLKTFMSSYDIQLEPEVDVQTKFLVV